MGFQRFDEGTIFLVLDEPKFVVLADVIRNYILCQTLTDLSPKQYPQQFLIAEYFQA